MRVWLLNYLIISVLLVLVSVSDSGVDKARASIIKDYVEDNIDYKAVLNSVEYKDRSLTSEQETIFISGSKQIHAKLSYLKIIWWIFVGLLCAFFSWLLSAANKLCRAGEAREQLRVKYD